MALRKLILLSLVLVLVLLAVATERVPTGSAQQNPSSPDAPLGESFTYQGQLKDDTGNPIDDTCAFRFRLFDAATFGGQVGTTQELPAVNVVNGYFTVPMNFGRAAFTGDARWLEVAVKCGGELDYTVLTPRQELTPVPYALNAELLDGEHASAFANAAHTHWGESWTGSLTGLSLSGGHTGLSSSASTNGLVGLASASVGVTYGVHGESASASGRGVYGIVTALDGFTYGVYGVSESTQGRGVYGAANADTGDTYGVFGSVASDTGRGVYGYANAEVGSTFGVYGETESDSGRGVYGRANDDSGYTAGVQGVSVSPQGVGVVGTAQANTGDTMGVFGSVYSPTGSGVYGSSHHLTGINYGVYGLTVSDSGRGVSGYADSDTGITYGVLGTSESPSGIGVYGYAVNTVGGETARGVVGRSDAPGGWGVQGQATSTMSDGLGVYGRSNAQFGYGVVGNATGDGTGVGAWSESGNLIIAFDGTYPYGTSRFRVSQEGNVYADGTYNSYKLSNTDGEARALTSLQSSEAWLEDFGRASLVDGTVTVSIAADFAGVADLSAEYFVFVTLEGDCRGVFITNKTPTSFDVRELNGGKSSIPFGYRLVARPAGWQAERLPMVVVPDTSTASAPSEDVYQPPAQPQAALPVDPDPNDQEGQP